VEQLNLTFFSELQGQPTHSLSTDYRVFMRAYLKTGYSAPMQSLRNEVSIGLPDLESLCYQQHLEPLIRRYTVLLEQKYSVKVKTIDIELQYYPHFSAQTKTEEHAA